MSKPQVEWIDDPADFATAMTVVRAAGVVGIDTEFVRTRTFYAQLGLIQIYDGAVCRLIDPLPIRDWGPLREFLADPGVIKVIHSGSEDVEIFNRIVDAPLAGFFDTQIAAALAGVGPSLSYQALVSELIGIDLPKGETRSDWLRRPLSAAQLTYAAHDVEYLPEVHRRLADALQRLQRSSWAAEDFASAAMPALTEEQTVKQQFRRSKFAWRLDPAQRSVAYRLLAWRERKARQIDRPRNRVLDDIAIQAIALAQPDSMTALQTCPELDAWTLKRNGDELLAIVRRALDDGDPPPAPKPPLERAERPLLNRLKGQVKRRAAELGLAPEVLCGARQLIYLMQHRRLPKRLRGWRREIIGTALLETLKQEAAVAENSL